MRGAFQGGADSLLTLTGVENVSIEARGATFRMWRSDYDNTTLYNHSESRHGLQIYGTRGLIVTGQRGTYHWIMDMDCFVFFIFCWCVIFLYFRPICFFKSVDARETCVGCPMGGSSLTRIVGVARV